MSVTAQAEYMDKDTGIYTTFSGTITAYRDIPLFVSAVQQAFTTSGGVESDPITGISDNTGTPQNEAELGRIKARWQWNFGDPTGEFDNLEGFNAAHIYTATGTYSGMLTITNE